jgi:hypothetical protein
VCRTSRCEDSRGTDVGYISSSVLTKSRNDIQATVDLRYRSAANFQSQQDCETAWGLEAIEQFHLVNVIMNLLVS